MATAAPPREGTLRDWIRTSHVCWEVAPHYELHKGARRQTGFDVTLHARRPPGCTFDPACPACLAVHEQLREILHSVLPVSARHAIAPFDAAFHLRPENQWEPELDEVVEVRDEGSGNLAKAVADALTRLGAPHRVWRPGSMKSGPQEGLRGR